MNFSNFNLIKSSNTVGHVFIQKNLLYINHKLLPGDGIYQPTAQSALNTT